MIDLEEIEMDRIKKRKKEYLYNHMRFGLTSYEKAGGFNGDVINSMREYVKNVEKYIDEDWISGEEILDISDIVLAWILSGASQDQLCKNIENAGRELSDKCLVKDIIS